jgi:hypothetical protein
MKILFVAIAGLKRNPVFSINSWIPAFAGMTFGVISIGSSTSPASYFLLNESQ